MYAYCDDADVVPGWSGKLWRVRHGGEFRHSVRWWDRWQYGQVFSHCCWHRRSESDPVKSCWCFAACAVLAHWHARCHRTRFRTRTRTCAGSQHWSFVHQHSSSATSCPVHRQRLLSAPTNARSVSRSSAHFTVICESVVPFIQGNLLQCAPPPFVQHRWADFCDPKSSTT